MVNSHILFRYPGEQEWMVRKGNGSCEKRAKWAEGSTLKVESLEKELFECGLDLKR